jgi:XTP/dITP diphosphohydrolase
LIGMTDKRPGRLVVATGNAGKLREFEALLAPYFASLVAQSELGVESVEETESSYLGNALLKARHAARATGLAALADDSGLEVDALGGAPGVLSARYAGDGADDDANNRKLLSALASAGGSRAARYRAVLVLVQDADDPAPLIAEATWEGRIASARQGNGGFGYDPLFLVGDSPVTAAQLSAMEKNRISHRATALQRLVQQIRG